MMKSIMFFAMLLVFVPLFGDIFLFNLFIKEGGTIMKFSSPCSGIFFYYGKKSDDHPCIMEVCFRPLVRGYFFIHYGSR